MPLWLPPHMGITAVSDWTGPRLRARRVELGIRRAADIAELMGLSPRRVRQGESEARPSARFVAAYLRALVELSPLEADR